MMTPASSMSCRLVLLLVLVIVDYLHLGIRTCQAGVTSRYMRILEDYAEDLPFDSPYLAAPPGYNAPQQVLAIGSIAQAGLTLASCPCCC